MRDQGPAASVAAMTAAARATLLVSFLAALGLGDLGCKKSGETIPAGEEGAARPTGDAVEIAYKSGAQRLRQDGKLTFRATEPDGVSEVKLDLSGTLDISDSNAGKLKVAYTVQEVRQADLSKNILESLSKEGPPPDILALVKAATGAQVVDLHGETDEAATKALPENKDKKAQGPGAAAEGFVGGLLKLPSELPPKPLSAATPLKLSERKKKPTPFGMQLDMDIATTYTLVKIDASSGKRIAEIKIESTQSGAHEEKGGGLIAVDIEAEGLLRFNVDDRLPVSYKLRVTQNINASARGQEISVEIMSEVDSTFAPA